MDVKLDEGSMQAVVAKAVLDSLTPEKRAELLTTAVKGLLEKPVGRDHWGAPSHLQALFTDAVREVARKLVTEQLTNDDHFKAQVQSLLADAAKKVFEGEGRDKVIEAVASIMSKAISGDRY